MSDETYSFENFPYRTLSIPIDRSKLLHSITEELSAHSQKVENRRVVKLADLGTCEKETLLPIIPQMIANSKISLKDKAVYGKSVLTGKTYRLFPISSPALAVYNLFNGTNTIERVCDTVRDAQDWTEEFTFDYVRGVFLSLVVAGLCMPKE